jgi:hypothetical protein
MEKTSYWEYHLRQHKEMFGTVTIKTEEGERLQISGFIVMPWYNVLIKFKD